MQNQTCGSHNSHLSFPIFPILVFHLHSFCYPGQKPRSHLLLLSFYCLQALCQESQVNLTFKTYPNSVPSHHLHSVTLVPDSIIPCWGYSSCLLLVSVVLPLPPSSTQIILQSSNQSKLLRMCGISWFLFAQNLPVAPHFPQSKTIVQTMTPNLGPMCQPAPLYFSDLLFSASLIQC